MGGWRNAVQEAAASKPLFVTIYATVILGIVASSFYVFSAIYSPSASATHSISTSWLSSLLSPKKMVYLIQAAAFLNQQEKHHYLVATSWDLFWRFHLVLLKMPPLESFRLTKELVGERAKDNVIIITFGNFAFMDFILTWVKHLTDLGVSNFLVGAMDTKLLEALYWKGVPVFDMGSHMSIIDVGWGSPTFHKMGREKVLLINSILPFGYELLMCDTDMVWLKNPLPYLARLADWKQVGAAYNIGIFHWRPTEPATKLAKEWKDMLLSDDKIWDQNGFNELVMYEQLRLEPYAVHTTFQYGGTEGKRHRLREAMVFYDPPEYYDAREDSCHLNHLFQRACYWMESII
ncbi:hypothetical protein F3Y22_tig00110057pilonHSYRG00292 [Hibiscus syriacus]|uniref:Nucleotide-diphospho-sugar transferase domain-containing protein n=1 Tax=Hibiscus syriacus TaxID=106335 RepID=A0A6A3BJR7_HIBSY|nr:hypothetical protein F3Y22_tig00110057pilonHSYRG00292 [Hibiscus syriacus]